MLRCKSLKHWDFNLHFDIFLQKIIVIFLQKIIDIFLQKIIDIFLQKIIVIFLQKIIVQETKFNLSIQKSDTKIRT